MPLRQINRLILILSLLLTGVFSYLLLSPNIYLFNWPGISNHKLIIPSSTISILVRNYLPDLLWAAAVNNTAILMSEKKIDAVYIYSLVAIPFISEILQTFPFIPGTFDSYDLSIYFIVFLFCFKSKISDMQKIKIFTGPLILAGYIITILACATTHKTKTTVEKPGFYGFDYSSRWNGGSDDVNGEVGHRMYVAAPTARCAPSGHFTADHSIVSGNFPPGLQWENSGIVGIPTERGHWVVKVKMYNIVCNGGNYDGFEQELRFHITGTGKVN